MAIGDGSGKARLRRPGAPSLPEGPSGRSGRSRLPPEAGSNTGWQHLRLAAPMAGSIPEIVLLRQGAGPGLPVTPLQPPRSREARGGAPTELFPAAGFSDQGISIDQVTSDRSGYLRHDAPERLLLQELLQELLWEPSCLLLPRSPEPGLLRVGCSCHVYARDGGHLAGPNGRRVPLH
jgi:hypothetical protein